jgi:hypothetical protein
MENSPDAFAGWICVVMSDAPSFRNWTFRFNRESMAPVPEGQPWGAAACGPTLNNG